jgi:hypothetical protein
VVKWHPGHYYAPMTFMRSNPTIMAQVYAELKATPALRRHISGVPYVPPHPRPWQAHKREKTQAEKQRQRVFPGEDRQASFTWSQSIF